MKRSVYVAGIGAITPLGSTWSRTSMRLARGDSAIRPVIGFDVSGFPCRVAAWIDNQFAHTQDRRLALAEVAASEAWDPRFAQGIDAARIGVFIGAESGRAQVATIVALARAAGAGQRFDHREFGQRAQAWAARIDASVVSPAAVATALAARIGAAGPVETVSLACASGSAAIAEAARAIRLGECDIALCGGVGADVDPLMLVGFGKLGALSERGISRPFDVHRDGFVVGEGAAMVVLCADRVAADYGAANSATAHAVSLTGIGRSLDAHHLTAPDPDGDGAFRAMRSALTDAGEPRIDYVQAHGTSTPLNDAIEARAIVRALVGCGEDARVSSVKGALGHWIAGAGALGCLCAIEAVRSGVMIPTAHLSEPDGDCDVRHVLGVAECAPVTAALVNAFAFGGANCSLIWERARV